MALILSQMPIETIVREDNIATAMVWWRTARTYGVSTTEPTVLRP
jgi:hypothetical protein